MSELVFKDPPETGGKGRWTRFLPELKARPGEWALIGEFDRTTATSGTGSFKAFGCEATTRSVAPGGPVQLYVRWPASKNGDAS